MQPPQAPLNLFVPSRAGLFAAHLTEVLWLAIMVVIPLTMNVAGMRTFEAAKLAAVAPLAALAFCALVAAWIEGAARLPAGTARQPALLGFAALTACAMISTAASDTPWIAFFGDYFRREGLVSWLIYAILFTAVLGLMRTRIQLERLIDALLLASVIPCIYALQPRYGYEFFMTAGLGGGAATARPGANLGNPIFLSAYLLLLIPVTIARLLGTPKPWSARLPWLVLLGLQLFCALLTQSRGPLLGLAAALFLLALLTGAAYRSRALVLGAIVTVWLLAAALLALNFVPAVQFAVKDYPLVQRFAFTSGASLTATSRIGIWQMGVDAFLHTSWWRQLVGAGPDAAHFSYFPHLPIWVMRIEGYTETIDRLHSEWIETAMTLGAAGALAEAALFSGIVWMAVKRIAGVTSRNAGVLFALLCFAASISTGAGLAWFGDARGLFPIGLGLGLALAWGAALAAAAWRGLGVSNPTNSNDRARSLLLFALVCALVGCWIELQVGVPTIASRSLASIFAALALLLGANVFDNTSAEPAPPAATPAPAQPSGKSSRSNAVAKAAKAAQTLQARARLLIPQTITGWLTGLILIVTTSAFFPPLSGQVIHAPSPQRLNFIIVPLLGLVIAGGVFAAYEIGRLKTSVMDALTRFLLWMAVPWFIYVVLYAQLGARITGAGDALVGRRINSLLLLEFCAGLVLCIVFAASLYWNDARRAATRPSKPLAIAALVAGMLMAATTFWGAMLDVRADSYAKLGSWALSQGRADASTAFHKSAAELLPAERRFSGTYAARLIEQAAAGLRTLPSQPGQAAKIIELLTNAEASIKRAVAVAPNDPWTTFAYANVNQFFALGVLEAYLPKGERQRRAGLARQYFELAHKQFPAHPWILRNWAQLEFDLGNRAAAYAKFDQMEALDPMNADSYSERLRFTLAYGDHSIATMALRKGIAAQAAGSESARTLRNNLAQYFNQIGQPAQALNLYLEMIQADPNDFAAVSNAVELYERSGQRIVALGNLQAALARIVTLPGTPKLAAEQKKLEALAARLGS